MMKFVKALVIAAVAGFGHVSGAFASGTPPFNFSTVIGNVTAGPTVLDGQTITATFSGQQFVPGGADAGFLTGITAFNLTGPGASSSTFVAGTYAAGAPTSLNFTFVSGGVTYTGSLSGNQFALNDGGGHTSYSNFSFIGAPEIDGSLVPQVALLLGCGFILTRRRRVLDAASPSA